MDISNNNFEYIVERFKQVSELMKVGYEFVHRFFFIHNISLK